MDEYKHYYRIGASGVIIHAFSDAFEQPQDGDVEELDGDGGRHFNRVIVNERGQFRYKIIKGALTERTQTELDEEWSARPAPPETDAQKIARLEDENAMMALEFMNSQIELMNNQTRLDQNEQAQADMLLMLVEGGVL